MNVCERVETDFSSRLLLQILSLCCMRRVLIVSYYWPPAGGGGVQRWLKMARYLPEHGVETIIYTPANPDYPILDPSLQKDVLLNQEIVKFPIREPYRIFRRLTGKGSGAVAAGFISEVKGQSRIHRLLGKVRGNFFIPDARILWVKPSVKFLLKWLRTNPVDAVITSGPPHSMHLIGLQLKRSIGIKWIADFRDPWVNMDNFDLFGMSERALNRHKKLEADVLREASEVVTVGWKMSADYEKLRGSNVHVITNGYDHEDFEGRKVQKTDRFIIGHYGTFGADRDAPGLWKALAELKGKPGMGSRLLVDLAGATDVHIIESVRNAVGDDCIHYDPWLSHNEIVNRMLNADVLLVVLNANGNEEHRLTGKVFEYLAAEKPILGIGSATSDCARVVGRSGMFFDRNDAEGIFAFLNSGDFSTCCFANHEQYSRRNLALAFSRLI